MVLQAHIVEEALRLLNEYPVSLLMIDQHLSDTAGKVARDVKAMKPQVCVVLRSDSPPDSMGDWDVFINKSEPAGRLIKTLRELVKRSCA